MRLLALLRALTTVRCYPEGTSGDGDKMVQPTMSRQYTIQTPRLLRD